MERRIVFLDIDGVLQRPSAKKRFEYCHRDLEKSEMPKIYEYLKGKFGIDFSVYDQYDVAAVYFDWDRTALALLKLVLNLTGAQIVLSSDWRLFGGFQRMKDFFTIHGLEKYFIDITRVDKIYGSKKNTYEIIDEDFKQRTEERYKEKYGKDARIASRSIEILDWLDRNPDVKYWVAIDDMILHGIEENYVESYPSMSVNNAEKCIRMLLPDRKFRKKKSLQKKIKPDKHKSSPA